MNKSKLREQIKSKFYYLNRRPSVRETAYYIHDGLDNSYDTIKEIHEAIEEIVNQALAQNRKAILEEVFTWFEGFLNTDEQRKVLQDKKLSLLEGETK